MKESLMMGLFYVDVEIFKINPRSPEKALNFLLQATLCLGNFLALSLQIFLD